MNPRIVVGLSSLLIWIISIIQYTLSNHHRPVAAIYLILAIFLFAGKRWAYRGYKLLLWLVLIVAVLTLLLILPDVSGAQQLVEVFTESNNKALGITVLSAWILYSASILYYLDTDNVRIEYDVDSRKKQKKQ